MNDPHLEMEVPNQALRELRELNTQRDAWTGGREWDELEPPEETELYFLACKTLKQNWEEYCRNFPPPSPKRRRDVQRG